MTVPLSPLQRVPRYLVREDVFSEEQCDALFDWMMAHEEQVAPSRIGDGQTAPNFRRSFSVPRQLERPLLPPLMERVREIAPGIMAELGMQADPIHNVEADMVVYRDGGFILPHIDTAATGSREATDRMLTMVYYFHREPARFSGGALRLLPMRQPPEGMPRCAEIYPKRNSIVAFAAWAPHEVLPISVPSGKFEDGRFAINFWVRRKAVGNPAAD